MSAYQLAARLDEFSYQVQSETDPRFWFRLVREADDDIITDFELGSFPAQAIGPLAVQCYRVLGLTPKASLIFRNILSGREPTTELVRSVSGLYESAGIFLLNAFGVQSVRSQITTADGKVNLTLLGFSAT